MQRQNHVDVLIAGMGPAGLAAAYEAAKKGKKVVVVEKRDGKFSRVQTVFIGYAIRQYLVSMMLGSPQDTRKLPDPEGYAMLRSLDKDMRKAVFRALREMGDDPDNLKNRQAANAFMAKIGIPEEKRDQFCKMLMKDPGKIIRNYQDMKFITQAFNPLKPEALLPRLAISHIERYLKHRIDDINEQYAAPPVEFMTHSTITALQGDRKKTAVVTTIDADNHAHAREISFDFLVGADGYKHDLANLVNATLKEQDKIKYENIPKAAAKRSDHVFLHFNLRLPARNSIQKEYAILRVAPPAQPNDPCLSVLTIDRHSAESSGFRTVKCTLTSEIVECLQPDPGHDRPTENLLAFLKQVIKESNAVAGNMKIEIEVLDDMRRPNRLKFSAFSTSELTQASKPWVEIGDGQVFFCDG